MSTEPHDAPEETNNEDNYAFEAFVVVGILYWLAGCVFAGVFTYFGAEKLAQRGAELAGLMLFTIPVTGAACAVGFRLLIAARFEARWTRSYRITFAAVALTVLTGVVWFSHAFEAFSPKPRPAATPRIR